MTDDLSRMPDADDSARGATFDARGQYYRLWMWYVAQAGQAAIVQDYPRWLRSTKQLYIHARAFLSKEERERIEAQLVLARAAFARMLDSSREGEAYRLVFLKNQGELEDAVEAAQAGVYEGMRRANMLLPESVKDEGGLDWEKAFREADLG